MDDEKVEELFDRAFLFLYREALANEGFTADLRVVRLEQTEKQPKD